jgi:hypothetical protein
LGEEVVDAADVVEGVIKFDRMKKVLKLLLWLAWPREKRGLRVLLLLKREEERKNEKVSKVCFSLSTCDKIEFCK